MTTITLTSVVRASDRQMSADLAGETVLLNRQDGVYYSLNEVGARIWSLIQQATPVGDVLDTLLAEYDTEPERCEADLFELLTDLRRLGLIEVADAPPP